ncbi:MAG: response regulator [Promethearchaeota archaeon]
MRSISDKTKISEEIRKKYKEETGKDAYWRGKLTESFKKWQKGEKLYYTNQERVSLYIPEGVKEQWEKFAKNTKFKTISALVREALDCFIKLYPKLKIEQKEDFDILSALSFELKEPLTLIKVNLQILKEVHSDKFDDNIIQIIDTILEYYQNLENKIIDYLDSPKIEQPKFIETESTQYDIFFVEDDYETRKVLINYFHTKGISCKGIVEGSSVFSELRINIPKLILLDILLPGMSGDDIMRDLNSDKEYNKIPVYFITAIPEYKVKKMAEDLGATGYILKPFSLSDFDQIITYIKKGK